MKRIIPKPSKVRTAFFKDWHIRDIAFLTCVFLLVFITGVSNIPGKLYIMLGLFTLGASLFFIKVEERLYYELYVLFRYIFSKKKFNGDEQVAIDKVEDDIIYFKGGYTAGVLKITPLEFFLLREEVQDKLINAFSVIYKNLAIGQKLSLIKLDRPIFLDDFTKDLKKKIANTSEDDDNVDKMKLAKETILKIRKAELDKINTADNCCYYNAFYIVVYGTKESVNNTLFADIRELSADGIETHRLENKELLGFIKRTYTQVFEERKIKDTTKLKKLVPKTVRYSKKFVEVDGIRETTFVVNRYPVETFNAWATALCNIDFTKVVINATPVALDKAIRQLDRSASELEEQYSKTGRISQQTESETHYASLKYLVEELGNNNEVMLDTNICITAYDYDRKGGEFRRQIRKTINKLGFRTSPMTCRQAEAFRYSTLNGSCDNKSVFTQGINSSSLAAAFPFVSNQILEKNGVMLGENSAPVIIDFFKRDDLHKNSNTVVLGSVGGGKSFFAKTMFTNLLSENVRLFVLDPEAEYSLLAENFGGQIIDMGSGGNIINPFAVLTDVSDDSENVGNLLLAHLTFLEEFFSTTLEGLGSENRELVLSLIPKLYERKGITPKIDLKAYEGDYPTFDDFYEFVEELVESASSSDERDKLNTVAMFLAKFSKNGRYSYLWNGQTNLKANADFIVFNFQTLLANANKTIASAQMLLLTQYLNNELIHNYNKIKVGTEVQPIVIAIDEAHVFIDPNNPVALRFMKNTAKRCRKYQGMQVVMTQSVNDFLGGVELERESKAVITESQYTFVFPLNASSASDFLKLYDKLDITNLEANEIMDNPRGTAFFIAHQRNRTSFRIIAPKKIRDIFERSVELENYFDDEEADDEVEENENTKTNNKAIDDKDLDDIMEEYVNSNSGSQEKDFAKLRKKEKDDVEKKKKKKTSSKNKK